MLYLSWSLGVKERKDGRASLLSYLVNGATLSKVMPKVTSRYNAFSVPASGDDVTYKKWKERGRC